METTILSLSTISACVNRPVCAILATVFVFAASAVPAFSWFDFGHMETACIAYKKLTPSVRARVDDLLKYNPSYKDWDASIPSSVAESDRNMYRFMLASTWPDVIKTNPKYHSDGADRGYMPVLPEAAQNIGYRDHLLHKYWHFINVPFTQDGTPLPTIPNINAETQIDAFRKSIASADCPDEVKAYDLVWLVHLIGDVHQPLHCIARATKQLPEGDSGGVKVQLVSNRADEPNNLHYLWDGFPGAERTSDHVVTAVKSLPRAPKKLAHDLTTKDWVAESVEENKKDVYVGPIKDGLGPFRLTPKYIRHGRKLALQRVSLAGERIAGVLNSELR